MKNLHGLGAFLESANSGTFTLAAERLGVSPAAISKSVAALEQQLGVRLFNRSTRSLSLTAEGRIFLESAGEAAHLLDEAVARLSQAASSPSGRVRISVGMSFGRRWVLPLLPQLAQKYPLLAIDVDLDNTQVNLAGSGFDIAIRGGYVEDSSRVARRICMLPLALLASPAYLKTAGTPQQVDDLAQHQIISLRFGDNMIAPWLFTEGGVQRQFQPQARITASDPDSIMELVLTGAGISQLALNVAIPFLRSGQLQAVLGQSHDPGSREMVLYYPHRQHMAQRVRVVVDALLAHFASVSELHQTLEDCL